MVYLLHFSIPYPRRSNGFYGAGVQHYVGYTTNLKGRMFHHRNGRGSKLIAAVVTSGRRVVVSRVWKNGERGLERRVKNTHGGVVPLCPLCSGKKANKRLQK